MSIFIVSPDAEAGRSLSSALGRSGRLAEWVNSVGEAQVRVLEDPPLVLVVDRAAPGFEELIEDVAARTPWVRLHQMVDGEHRDASDPAIEKPFDAAELAMMLAHEEELADVDRRRHSSAALAEELGTLVEASFDSIVGLGPKGTIRSWNGGATAIYGYAPDEIVGRSIEILEQTPGAAMERLERHDRQAIEVVRRRKDGGDVLVLLSLSPVPGGRTFAFAETSVDITLRRRLERELEHEKRLAAIGRIAAGMAHEINNPLAVVRAANAYVAEVARATNDALLIETVEDVRLAVDRIGGFVSHVQGFARRERPTLTDAAVRESVRMALRLAKPRAAERRVEMVLETGSDVRLPHDAARLSQAVLNLVSNAIDAASEGAGHVWIRVVVDASSVRIQVDDDGPGVQGAIRGRAFEPFATTKPQGQGTGLGLAITRQIIDDHGGAVSLDPRPGGPGTRAEIVLPLVARVTTRAGTRSSRPPSLR